MKSLTSKAAALTVVLATIFASTAQAGKFAAPDTQSEVETIKMLLAGNCDQNNEKEDMLAIAKKIDDRSYEITHEEVTRLRNWKAFCRSAQS